MCPTQDSPPPRTPLGTEALAALAVPARFAILNHLLAAGPRTASQCAAVVGETASNCSWHLRALAKVGLVEPAESLADDARARPWGASVVGFEIPDDNSPASALAQAALSAISTEHSEDLYRRYIARREALPSDWKEVGGENRYSLLVTPDELRGLLAAVDELIRPYVRPIRDDAPAASEVAQFTVRAFLDPDVHVLDQGEEQRGL